MTSLLRAPHIPEERGRQPRCLAFSLLELMVVVAIIAILAAITVPALDNVMSSTSLVEAGQMISDQLVHARQQATVLNTGMELRFIIDDTMEGGPAYTAVQLWQLDRYGRESQPLGPTVSVPASIIINPQLSDLLSKIPSASATFPSVGQRSYVGLRYRPNGRLEAQTTLAEACITVQLRHASRTQPTNYYTLQINPLTGQIVTYRP